MVSFGTLIPPKKDHFFFSFHVCTNSIDFIKSKCHKFPGVTTTRYKQEKTKKNSTIYQIPAVHLTRFQVSLVFSGQRGMHRLYWERMGGKCHFAILISHFQDNILELVSSFQKSELSTD